MNPILVLVVVAVAVGLLFVAFMDRLSDHADWTEDEIGRDEDDRRRSSR